VGEKSPTVRLQIERPEAEAYELMAAVMASNAAHHDAQEGIEALLAKREPVALVAKQLTSAGATAWVPVEWLTLPGK